MVMTQSRSNAASTTNGIFPEILRDGTTYASDKLIGLEVETSLRLPGMAILRYADDDTHSLAQVFKLEQKIEIKASGAPNNQKPTVFKGEVVAIEGVREAGETTTIIRCYDELWKLYVGRKTRTFVKKKYSDIVSQVARENGLTTGKVDPNGPVHEYVVQLDESDGELLDRLASEYGFIVTLDADWKLMFGPMPTATGSPPLPGAGEAGPQQLLMGDDLTNYEITYGPMPAGTVKTFGWDVQAKRSVLSRQTVDMTKSLTKFEKLTPKAKQGDFLLSSRVLPLTAAADAAAKGYAAGLANGIASLRGRITGNPFIVAGKEVAVGPKGTSFAGWFIVTSALHIFDDGRLTTEIVCDGVGGDRGTAATAPLAALSTSATAGATSPGGMPYLTTGIVTDLKDPTGLGRVKVKLPSLGIEEQTSDWLRVIGLGNADKRGMWWLPEINDEVVVAFEQGDMRHGYVLGGVHNGKDLPEFGAATRDSGKADQRSITTKAGHQLLFTEKQGEEAIELHSGDKKYVMKYDQKNAVFTINVNGEALMIKLDDKAGIVIQANKDITVESKQGNLALTAMKNVAIESKSGDVTVKGVNVKATANANFEATANAQAKVSGSAGTEITSPAITKVQGSLVQIN